MDNQPFILQETDDYAVVYKPAKMHCKGQIKNNKEEIINSELYSNEDVNITLCDFVLLCGLKIFDIMHRLDYETNGLVLFAKNGKSYAFLKSAQDNGEFVKEYSAIIKQHLNKTPDSQPGFPPFSPCPPWLKKNSPTQENPYIIESYFRPFGKGRKLVRPVIEDGKKHKEVAKDKGGFYRTEIININDNILTVRIKRGFRHQIRCHLCWIGCPILNDPLYSGEEAIDRIMGLRSHALFFPEPGSGKLLEFRIEGLL